MDSHDGPPRPSWDDDHPTGAHGLGPHVVGQRVVVRRVLPGETGPSGGPAMTDVLGVCESWAGGVVRVRRADGSVVEVATRDIVSGKPVPPRPSVLMRVGVREAEQHTLALWPDVEQVALGEWVLRSRPVLEGRLVKRANSVLAIGSPQRPDTEAVRAVTDFYAARGRPALAQVERGSDAERAFTDRGWHPVPGGDADHLLASSSRVRRALPRDVLRDLPRDTVEVRAEGPRLEAALEADGRVVARGRAALSGDWLGVHGLEVDPAYRRRGLGTAVLAALLERGAEEGAGTVWLHVEVGNDPARALYDALGFAAHHRVGYLAAPQDR